MSSSEIVEALYVWTPFLAGGYVWNVIVSLAAMGIGTAIGAVLALMRVSHRSSLVRASLLLTGLTRNIPTFVFLFYLAFLIPAEIQFGSAVHTFPVWLKASFALAIAVVGFVSDNLADVIGHWRRHDFASALMFIPNWTSYFVIIVMASSTASVIGVGELVSRCNTVIAAVGKSDLMLWIYLYAMTWFFVTCYPVTLLMRRVKVMIAQRLTNAPPTWLSRHAGEPEPGALS
jgi:polar amino acid transport system permease protein